MFFINVLCLYSLSTAGGPVSRETMEEYRVSRLDLTLSPSRCPLTPSQWQLSRAREVLRLDRKEALSCCRTPAEVESGQCH